MNNFTRLPPLLQLLRFHPIHAEAKNVTNNKLLLGRFANELFRLSDRLGRFCGQLEHLVRHYGKALAAAMAAFSARILVWDAISSITFVIMPICEEALSISFMDSSRRFM